MTILTEKAIKFLKARFRGSLFQTARYLLGFDKLNRDNIELCQWIQDRIDPINLKPGFYMIICPRETYKSTICSQALPIWLLLGNPNLSIMLGSNIQRIAVNWLRVIKRKVMSLKFIRIFGEWFMRDEWRDTDIIIADRDVVIPEPSIDCIGVGMTVTSKHPKVIILDDIVTPEDRDSPAKRESTKKFLDEIFDLLDKTSGVLFVIGTPWHVQDLFAHITQVLNPKLKAEGMKCFDIYKKPAIDKDGELGFPNIHSAESLKQIRLMKTDISVFSSNYLLEPINPSTQIFKRADFGYFDYSEKVVKERITGITMFCDPSLGDTAKGDPSAIIVLGKTIKNKYAVLEADIEVRQPTAIMDAYISLFVYYKNLCDNVACWMESNGMQVLMKNDLTRKALKKDIRLPLKGFKNTANKIARITGIERHTTARLVLFRSDWESAPRNYRHLIYQLESFPQGHDDGPDALEGAISRAEKGRMSVGFV